ncbi:DUF3467 domain-containing protein [Desulfosarcina variabilis]|uniref:DUF3467 domain-containing protein n=1 Tax=Desulfosarcina variabilis TaxID=2300 RepID=UPI003AFAC600
MRDQHNCREPEARWANQFKTGFREHVIELVFYQKTNTAEQRILTRIIASPDDAKELLLNLSGTIEKYEAKFGPLNASGVERTSPDTQ